MSGSEIPVLVVEDDGPIRRLLRLTLGAHGYRVTEAASGRAALAAQAAAPAEVILLDLGLPDMDGVSLIRRWRGSGDATPVIVLSSRSEERAKVEALELGADDYLTKPFGMAELMARIRTALRHRIRQEGAEPVYEHAGLRIDLTARQVFKNGAEVKLSNKEWDIVRLLALNAGRVLTHRRIMETIWGPTVDVQYLRIYIRQIRRKIEMDPERPEHIVTETGIGYRLARPG